MPPHVLRYLVLGPRYDTQHKGGYTAWRTDDILESAAHRICLLLRDSTRFSRSGLLAHPLLRQTHRERERERESPPFNPRPLQSPTQTRDRVPKGVESKKLHRMGASRLLPEAILTLCRSRANEPPS